MYLFFRLLINIFKIIINLKFVCKYMYIKINKKKFGFYLFLIYIFAGFSIIDFDYFV